MKKSDGLKELEQLSNRKKVDSHPLIPPHARVATKWRDDSANGLTKCVLTWLTLNCHKAWRQSAEGRYRQGNQYTDCIGRVHIAKGQYIPGTNTGHGDVASVINGQFVSWEIKMKDKQSPKQKRFQEEVEASGGKYFIVRSFDEFMGYYKSIIK